MASKGPHLTSEDIESYMYLKVVTGLPRNAANFSTELHFANCSNCFQKGIRSFEEAFGAYLRLKYP